MVFLNSVSQSLALGSLFFTLLIIISINMEYPLLKGAYPIEWICPREGIVNTSALSERIGSSECAPLLAVFFISGEEPSVN